MDCMHTVKLCAQIKALELPILLLKLFFEVIAHVICDLPLDHHGIQSRYTRRYNKK